MSEARDAKRQKIDGSGEFVATALAPAGSSSHLTKAAKVKKEERILYQYFCVACGKHTIDVVQPIEEEPKRRSEAAYAVPTAAIHALDLDYRGAIRIRRAAGLEQQYRYQCKGCQQLVGYVSFPPGDAERNVFTYIVEGTARRNAATVTASEARL
eukprot:c32516_g1_i1.p1 GENE.c32516_g1_i1~~c32516_g1_i1.p1  ORF type:complete len:155 (+),score=30.08 c32516_g1_i1:113-577(+)